jgi:hypothetical protein
MTITKINNASSSGTFVILFPVVVLILGVLLLIFVVPQSYSYVVDSLHASQEQKTQYENLQKKLSTLQSVSPVLLSQTGKAVQVLPERNPVLPFISQMKSLAIEKQLEVTDIRSNAITAVDTVQKLELEVSLQGDSTSTINAFLIDLSNHAPLVTLDDTTITEIESVVLAKVKMSVYWSPLPNSLPSLTDPLPPFTSDELQTLQKFDAYTVSEFTTLPPADTEPRENPFN